MKNKIEDLAIFGGKKTFKQKLHVGAPNDVNRDIFFQKIDRLLETKRFTNRGPFVREMESRIANFIGVKHCILMCNATIALEIVFRALGLCGEVILPSMTFIATAHALQWQQIKPVFCDINPFTYNLDPKRIEMMVTPNTSGIVGVHLWGRPCEIEELESVAHKRNLKLIFDAAHAFGCSYKGKMIGQFGDAEVFSFHATKFINSFEGGAVVTNNDGLAEKIRLLENYEEITSINYNNYQLYKRVFEGLPGVRMLTYNEKEVSNYQYIVLEIDEKKTQINRDKIMQILHAENIIARRYFYPGCHRMEPYKSYQPYASLLVPVTEKLVKRILTLPNGTSISEGHIYKIGQIFHYVLANANKISCNMDNIQINAQNRSNLAM